MSRKEIAMELFEQGYNCSQAVSLAFLDKTGLEKETLAKMALSFGGGLGRMREVCGAVSGMAIVLGLVYGNAEPGYKKADHYKRVQEVAKKFEEENGSIICRELLKTDEPITPNPEPRTKQYYKKRPCNELVGMAAEILEEYLNNN